MTRALRLTLAVTSTNLFWCHSLVLAGEGGPAVPKDLTVWGMFAQAGLVVQAVMVGLALCSVATWSVFFAKSLEFRSTLSRLEKTSKLLEKTTSLTQPGAGHAAHMGIGQHFLREAIEEIALSQTGDRQGIKERIQARIAQMETTTLRRAMSGISILATIGSVSPFVGLFGTVWGIMNSFIGISKAQTTNLAVVAPGIAEALLATAIGLVAAIPAVVIYNYFTRKLQAQKALLRMIGTRVMVLASRELDTVSSPGVR